jgi:hypothetical protein
MFRFPRIGSFVCCAFRSLAVVHYQYLPDLVLRVPSDNGDLPTGPTEVVFRSWRQTKQLPRLADIDNPFWNVSSLSSSAAINPRSIRLGTDGPAPGKRYDGKLVCRGGVS